MVVGNIMKAVIFESVGKVAYVDREEPRIEKPGDVKLKILAASICGSDLHITSVPQSHFATPGVILGHECVAQIVEMGGPNPYFKVGDRVLVNPMIPCGDCDYCKNGQVNMCSTVQSVGEACNGLFAEYFVVDSRQLHKLGADVPIDTAIFAEPLACAYNGFRRLQFLPGQSVLILGAGPIGLLFARLFRAAGAGAVIVSEVAPFRLNFAKEYAGADAVVNSAAEDIGECIRRVTGRPLADVVVDTVGTQIVPAIEHAAYEGKVLLFGINDSVTQTIRQYAITRKELTIVSSYATFNTFPLVEKMLASHAINLDTLLTHRMELRDLGKGLDMLRHGEAMKVVVYPHGIA